MHHAVFHADTWRCGVCLHACRATASPPGGGCRAPPGARVEAISKCASNRDSRTERARQTPYLCNISHAPNGSVAMSARRDARCHARCHARRVIQLVH
eukprot:IDg15568t1